MTLTDDQRRAVQVSDTMTRTPDGARDTDALRDVLEMLGVIPSRENSRELCGTWQGRNRHTHMREPICSDCQRAYSAYRKERRQR